MVTLTPIISGLGFIKGNPYEVLKADDASSLLIAVENNPDGLWLGSAEVMHIFGEHVYERSFGIGFMVLRATNPSYFTHDTISPKTFSHLSIWDNPDLSEKFFGVEYDHHESFVNQMMQHPRVIELYNQLIESSMGVPPDLLSRKEINKIARSDNPDDLIGRTLTCKVTGKPLI